MSELFDVVIVGSGAGGGMSAYVLSQAGARVAVVEAGGHNIDRDLRHHEWPWELPMRDSYRPDPVQVRLTTKEEVVGKGIEDRVPRGHRRSCLHWSPRGLPVDTRREGQAQGRYVVLSASAIETARILLNSKSNLFPDGLANSSGQVGRHLVEDAVAHVGGVLPQLEGREVVNEDSNTPWLRIHPFVNMDDKTRSKDLLRRYLIRCSGGFAMGGSGNGFGPELKANARRGYGSDVGVTGAGCGLEDPNNFVDIDPEVKDAWGIPVVRIHLRHGKNQEAMVRDMVRRGVELIEAAGGKVTSYTTSTSIPGAQIHEQGVCRMGDDPRNFVTNRWGRTHEVPNLVLADGSIHCTSGITDPTVTILALTMRNAEHLADEVRKGNM